MNAYDHFQNTESLLQGTCRLKKTGLMSFVSPGMLIDLLKIPENAFVTMEDGETLSLWG